MAWKRGRRSGRRRFFRGRGRRIRPSVPAGNGRRSFERCQFTFGVDQPVAGSSNPTYDIIQLVSPSSMVTPMTISGTQARDMARLLQLPLRGYEVLAVQYDVHAMMSPGVLPRDTFASTNLSDFAEASVLVAHDLYTQRVDLNGAPVQASVVMNSQWPVLQNGVPAGGNEDWDYAVRTHYHRSNILWPNILDPASDTNPSNVQGRIACSFSVRARLRRRFGDTEGLYIQFSNLPTGTLASYTIWWRVSGSLWYRMAW